MDPNYIPRDLKRLLLHSLRNFPAVMVTGPRQSGKTTFLRETLPGSYRYASFDDPLQREFALRDPGAFLNQFSESGAILDEIQYVPGLLPRLKMAIDADRKVMGKWVLTGSQQFNMMAGVSESLAGRIAVLNLLSFHCLEHGLRPDMPASEVILTGGYPENVINPANREHWSSSYIATYLERDVRQLRKVQDLSLFQTFLSLCAASHGRELSYASISKEAGISQPAVKEWVSVLTASGIIYLLRPHYANFGKRLIKTPKLYFLDSAIPAYLTRQPSADALFSGPMGGAFFEGFVVTEVHKMLTALRNRSDIWFWRSNDQMEVNLIVELDGIAYPVEIKKTATPTLAMGDHPRRFLRLAGERGLKTGGGFVVCSVREPQPLGAEVSAVPWRMFLEKMYRLARR